jgi:predicted N-formylglutamate amidohydrolase
LADALGATPIQQNYSRLVIDCNRPLDATTSISVISERTPIPGNVGLSEAARAARPPNGSKPSWSVGGKPAVRRRPLSKQLGQT